MLAVDFVASRLGQILLAFGLKAVKLGSVARHDVLVGLMTSLRVLRHHLPDLVRSHRWRSTDKSTFLSSLFETLQALAFGLVDG